MGAGGPRVEARGPLPTRGREARAAGRLRRAAAAGQPLPELPDLLGGPREHAAPGGRTARGAGPALLRPRAAASSYDVGAPAPAVEGPHALRRARGAGLHGRLCGGQEGAGWWRHRSAPHPRRPAVEPAVGGAAVGPPWRRVRFRLDGPLRGRP
eukprot:6562137-Lingulodinium_polyedra.AAC.1